MLSLVNSLVANIDLSSLQVLDEVTTFCDETKSVWILIGNIIKVLQIGIPVIIVLLGSIDLGKAVMASDDKMIKEAQKMFIKRLIYGVVVFFVVFVVRAVFSIVPESSTSYSCWCNVAGKIGGDC